jgi:hypothetical protein
VEDRVITLELVIKKRTLEELDIIRQISRAHRVTISPFETPTIFTIPNVINVAIEAIQHNQNIKGLQVEGDDTIPIMEIVRALRGKTIESLIISNAGLTSDEMEELFGIISENHIQYFQINSDHNEMYENGNFRPSTYRMKDLVKLLDGNTSLTKVYIGDTYIEIGDEDISDLVSVLSYKTENDTDISLKCVNNRFLGQINQHSLITSLHSIILCHLDISDNQIVELWYEDGLDEDEYEEREMQREEDNQQDYDIEYRQRDDETYEQYDERERQRVADEERQMQEIQEQEDLANSEYEEAVRMRELELDAEEEDEDEEDED